jgi:hypothetical protein
MLASANPVLDPLLVTPLRNAVVHSAWGRGKIDIPPGIAKKLNDTTVVTSSNPVAPAFRPDLAKRMRVNNAPDHAKGQKFQVRDERKERAAPPQVSQAPQRPAPVERPQQQRGPQRVERPSAPQAERAARPAKQQEPRGERVAAPVRPDAPRSAPRAQPQAKQEKQRPATAPVRPDAPRTAPGPQKQGNPGKGKGKKP